MFRFEALEIWKLAIEYGNDIYNLVKEFPLDEKYNLIDQLRRAALSISNNIAEGSGTATNKNFSSFLDISLASTYETVNLLFFAERRQYISSPIREQFYKKPSY